MIGFYLGSCAQLLEDTLCIYVTYIYIYMCVCNLYYINYISYIYKNSEYDVDNVDDDDNDYYLKLTTCVVIYRIAVF